MITIIQSLSSNIAIYLNAPSAKTAIALTSQHTTTSPRFLPSTSAPVPCVGPRVSVAHSTPMRSRSCCLRNAKPLRLRCSTCCPATDAERKPRSPCAARRGLSRHEEQPEVWRRARRGVDQAWNLVLNELEPLLLLTSVLIWNQTHSISFSGSSFHVVIARG